MSAGSDARSVSSAWDSGVPAAGRAARIAASACRGCYTRLMDTNIVRNAALNAFGTALYICVLASALFYGGEYVHVADNTVLMPIMVPGAPRPRRKATVSNASMQTRSQR